MNDLKYIIKEKAKRLAAGCYLSDGTYDDFMNEPEKTIVWEPLEDVGYDELADTMEATKELIEREMIDVVKIATHGERLREKER